MSELGAAWGVPRAATLRELAFRKVDQVILGELERARPRLHALKEANPKAGREEIVDLIVGRGKSFGGTGGLVSGFFGLAGVPMDLVMVTYIQISVTVEVALLYDVNLKSSLAQQEVLDIVARGNGVAPLVRGGTPVLARVAFALLRRRGWPALGRAFPLVAMPLCAWFNSRDIDRVGRTASRHYEGLKQLAARRGRSA